MACILPHQIFYLYLMIHRRTPHELALLQQAGHIVALCHEALRGAIAPGTTGLALDGMVEQLIRDHGATPIFKGYHGFPNATCISINDRVVHGIPNHQRLKEGDVVSIDVGVKYQGYIGDSAWSYGVGPVQAHDQFLLHHTEHALWAGLAQIKAGAHLSNISHAIEHYAKQHQLGIVKSLSGHGVGTALHEPPTILNYGPPHQGPILQAGMVLAIEPILTQGAHHVRTLQDGWTMATRDGKNAAHFEHTIAVQERGYQILTQISP